MNFAVEPMTTALLLAIFGVLLATCVLLKRSIDRIGIPVALLFLVLGMLAGSEGLGKIAFEDYQLAFRLGTVALIIILFDGGLNTKWTSVAKGIAPASILATFGVIFTAALTAVGAYLLGLPWPLALLLGAVVSSTDAATVFAVLRGSRLLLRPKLNATLELESGLNDPMAVILTITLTEALLTGTAQLWHLLYSVPLELLIGAAIGVSIGYAARFSLAKARLTTAGLYPILTLAAAFLAFGTATIAHGSGFLAVYVCALILGNGHLPARGSLIRVHDTIAWLSQIGMFLMLGLLVFPSRLLDAAPTGLGIALILTFIARPVAVALCLFPFRFPPTQLAYIGWVGLRGAVPVILAVFPVLAKAPGADEIFNIVFFVVVANAILPGSTVRYLTRRWNLSLTQRPTPAAALEIHSANPLGGELASFHIHPSLAVCNATLAEITFPPDAAAVLLVRGGTLLPCRGDTRLLEDDHIYIYYKPEAQGLIELLFGSPQDGEG